MHDATNEHRDAAPPPEPWILHGVPDPPWRAAVRAAAPGLVWLDAPGATIKDAPTQPTLFGAQPPRQSIFVTDSDIPSARSFLSRAGGL